MPTGQVVPRWDEASRTLWLGELLLKEFRDPTESQVTVLAEFERLGWPRRVEDPLPKTSGTNRKKRLQETVKNLKRSLKGTPLHFRMDGTAHGICVAVGPGSEPNANPT